MNLIADIGNTRVKLAVIDGGQIVVERSAEQLDAAVLDELLAVCPSVKRAIVSSTREDVEPAAELIRKRVGHCLAFTSEVAVPITNGYLTPQTLGRDRLAAAVGAATLYPGRNVLIVDCGTALTIDLVTADNTFRGGFISPGVRMRLRALNDYTARLPLCEPTEDPIEPGVTTQSAIRQGVMAGMAYEIEGHVAHIGAQCENLCIIFTGGDAKYFVKRIKNTIFANRNPVMYGLDRILEYNASEENPD